MTRRVIGVDPGSTTGICAIECRDFTIGVTTFLQCDPKSAASLVEMLSEDSESFAGQALVAVEQYVISGRSSRSGTTSGRQAALDVIGSLNYFGPELRNAATVKTWATDKRLAAAGLLDRTKGMTHARDAARHALYAAVHRGLLPDPLSEVKP